MIVATREIDQAFLAALEGKPDEWKMRAIAGHSTRTLLDEFAADNRGNEREQADRHGLSRAFSDAEREAWTFGFTWPDRKGAP